jgi:methyltransferase (TIGR00027 family)
LAEAGFRTGTKTFFIWEGVTQYITSEAVDATFQYLSRAAAGSKIVFTYIDRGIIEGSVRPPGTEEIISETQRCGEPWIFGIDPSELPQYLAARGFTLIEDVGASEYRVRYLEPLGRKMNIFEGERTVLAAQAPSETER